MILFQTTIPGRVPVKKNQARRFRQNTVYSDAYIAWEKTAYLQLVQEWKNKPPIKELMHAEFIFYFESHQWEPDCTNVIEGPQDLLKKAGIILDDKLIYRVVGEKIFGLPAARVDIFLMKHNSGLNHLRNEK